MLQNIALLSEKKKCIKGKIQMGSYKHDVLCSVGWRNAAFLQDPTSAPSL